MPDVYMKTNVCDTPLETGLIQLDVLEGLGGVYEKKTPTLSF